MANAIFNNLTQLQTVKPIHKTDTVYRVVTAVNFSISILNLLITQHERTDH